MDRRSFLKLSTLFAASVAINSNPVLKAIATSTENQSNKVLLYLIQNKNGDWKVLWSRYTELEKKKINSNLFNVETFKPLEIVESSIANSRRDELWTKYDCKGQKGFKINPKQLEKWQKLSYMHPNTLRYSRSEENKIRLFKVVQRERGKRAGKKNVISGHWDSIKHLGTVHAHSASVCPHCGMSGDTVNIKRHHFDKCQQRPESIKLIFDRLNDTFTKKHLSDAIIQCGFNQHLLQAILRNDNILELIHRGVKGSTKNINIYKKKQIHLV